MRILVVGLLALAFASSAGAAPNRAVEVWVVEPSNAQTTVTSAQAVTASILFLDEINAWFQREVGQVFDYRIQTLAIGPLGGDVDACGSYAGPVLFAIRDPIGTSAQDRSMVLMLGAGGWAGHFAPPDKQVPHFGMVGDWGVMELYDAKVSCIPDWDFPNRGFSHEFAGMMGMYVGGGCYVDGQGCFVNDPLSAIEKAALLKYSGKWLH